MQLLTKEFVFSDEPRQRLLRHGLFWLVWCLFFAFTYGFLPVSYLIRQGHSWPMALAKGVGLSGVDSLLFMPAHMFLTYGLIYWVLPRFLFKGHYVWVLFGTVALIAATSFVSAMLTTYLVDPVRTCLGLRTSGNTFFFAMMAGLRGAITIGGFAVAIKLIKVWYLKQQAYQQIDREKLQTELELLKSQVHPHFLFNTLNNLYSLTLNKSDRASAVVLKLSDLLRYMLYECNVPAVSLKKELDFLRNYIALEQLRYGDRLDMSVSISGDHEHKLIAPLLLIPFLENAFKHGTSEQLEQAWMHIELSVQGTTLKFKVINSRETMPHEENYTGGIGLQNVQKRLQLLYPNKHDLRIVAGEETFMVMLNVELLTAPVNTVWSDQVLAEVA